MPILRALKTWFLTIILGTTLSFTTEMVDILSEYGAEGIVAISLKSYVLMIVATGIITIPLLPFLFIFYRQFEKVVSSVSMARIGLIVFIMSLNLFFILGLRVLLGPAVVHNLEVLLIYAITSFLCAFYVCRDMCFPQSRLFQKSSKN